MRNKLKRWIKRDIVRAIDDQGLRQLVDEDASTDQGATLKCHICGTKLDFDDIGAVVVGNGRAMYICQELKCITKAETDENII